MSTDIITPSSLLIQWSRLITHSAIMIYFSFGAICLESLRPGRSLCVPARPDARRCATASNEWWNIPANFCRVHPSGMFNLIDENGDMLPWVVAGGSFMRRRWSWPKEEPSGIKRNARVNKASQLLSRTVAFVPYTCKQKPPAKTYRGTTVVGGHVTMLLGRRPPA